MLAISINMLILAFILFLVANASISMLAIIMYLILSGVSASN